jgi:uncharacterized membrane protein YdbT with pleckstrin-like domain
MFNLNKHLGTKEHIIMFFRPSRKAYVFQYVLIVVLLVLSLYFLDYGDPSSNLFILYKFINLASYPVMIIALIMLIRLEYRIFSRRYGLTNERVIYSRGIFTEAFRSASYRYITDIVFQQSFFDKIMNTGSLKIDTAGTDNYEIRFRKVNKPIEIKKKINDMQQNMLPVKKKKA